MKRETTSKPVRELVDDFHRGAILLPQFQRDYVWKANKVRNLLDSLFRGLPIGSFYLCVPSKGPLMTKTNRAKRGQILPQFKGYLIDGQQRLTSLEAAYGLYSDEDRRGKELRCYLDLNA